MTQEEIIQKLRTALRAIEEREGQWVRKDHRRYVNLTVEEMTYLLMILEDHA